MPCIRNVGGVRPQPFYIRVSCFKCVTTGNDVGTNNVLKLNHALGYVSSVYGATTVAKVSLFSTWTRSTISFYSMQASFSCEQTSVI